MGIPLSSSFVPLMVRINHLPQPTEVSLSLLSATMQPKLVSSFAARGRSATKRDTREVHEKADISIYSICHPNIESRERKEKSGRKDSGSHTKSGLFVLARLLASFSIAPTTIDVSPISAPTRSETRTKRAH